MISKQLILEPGNLPHRVQVLKLPDAPTTNSFGEVTSRPTVIGTAYAGIKQLTGNELLAAQQVQADVTHQITMRWRPGVVPKMQLQFQGRTFNILRAENVEERNRVLMVWVKEVV